ncbi:MAG: alpha-hydroxy-acid oxidizing protein [Roseateles asaccharophilus]|uniref:4-hydroxymandelate oxidase n=1 Tax=Roseateles asaccharophilus TaxID=582607 RepID=A0A4R6NBC1_9BURK|nr:alpha-hydroxy acid oxidase [Roseateles asaccharophilus]MDN3543049.1 alpha-hydroxy acid oxidase [Roseateles asaccharophilus]TDP13253.1 4-hydroxymandelate oxidase [Roseateles asaccharophilus]
MSESGERPALQSLPEGIVNLADFEAHAQACMTPSAWAYLNGGAADEQVMRANRAAWDALKLWPRVLRDLCGGHTRTSMFGKTWPTPLLLAPIAYQRLAHPDGELASAYAAAAQGAGMILSAQASVPMEAVARAMRQEPTSGPLWFQLYWRDDRGFMAELLQRVQSAGFEALVLTVDAPVQGARDRERRAGFQLPDDVRAVNLGGRKKPLDLAPGQSALFDGLMPRAATWSEIDWLRERSPLPLLLKGLCHPEDAREAMRRGVSGLVVSNHGGRTLDALPSTAELLPLLREVVGPDLPLLVDGGIRRGSDVLKALCLGADAVLLGRPYVHALATAGALGVAQALRLLRDEFEIAMALVGCRDVGEAGAHLLWPSRI